MEQEKRPASPGLKWRSRKNGPPVPYWFADKKAVEAGYGVKSANLSDYADNAPALLKRAQRLQDEMLLWMKGARRSGAIFDGKFKSLLDIYETDPDSSFHTLKHGTAKLYGIYLKKLHAHIGDLRIERTDGRAVKRWFADWRTDEDGSDHLPRAQMVLAVLKAAVRFGIVCRLPGCSGFKEVLSEMEFERPRSRTLAPTAEHVIAARKAAHENGASLRALVYALQFETTLRQWDITGQWLPMSDPKPSAVLAYGMKWVGPTWAAIDGNLIMAKIKPTKTEDTTEIEVSFDLSVCPMVMEELEMIPESERVGPLIVHPTTKLPYRAHAFSIGWRKDFKKAGLPPRMWNRDLRAGGVTEGGQAGATIDDRRKLAGHSKPKTTEIYDRDTVAAHRRVMAQRTAFRPKNAS